MQLSIQILECPRNALIASNLWDLEVLLLCAVPSSLHNTSQMHMVEHKQNIAITIQLILLDKVPGNLPKQLEIVSGPDLNIQKKQNVVQQSERQQH